MSVPAILLEELLFSYPPALPGGQHVDVLRGLTLEVPTGQALAIMGATGSGKTTLALILAALAPEMTGGNLRGRVQVNGQDVTQVPAARLSAHLGLVFQEPERQLFNMTVADEVAFGLEGLAVPPAEIADRVRWALTRVGLADPDLLDRAPWQLSGGQQKRLAIATILALRPPILVLDEPMAGLDPQGRREVASVLRELAGETGATVIVLEKDAEFVARWAERLVVLAEGRVGLDGPPSEVFRQVDRLHALGVTVPQIAELAARLDVDTSQTPFLTAQQAAGVLASMLAQRRRGDESHHLPKPGGENLTPTAAQEPMPEALDGSYTEHRRQETSPAPGRAPALAVDIRDLTFAYPGGTQALARLSLAVPAGQFVAIVGPNGGGKSTLARHLNGLLRSQSGSVAIHGRPVERRPVGELAREVGYVFQNPDHQIFASTVREEIGFGLRNLGLRDEALKRQADQALAAFDLQPVAEVPPAVLGYGLRRLVTVASVWAMQPSIWVLDEPTTGLDARYTGLLARHMRDLHQTGRTILLITHDLRLAASLAERIVIVHKGQTAIDGPPETVLGDAQTLSNFGLRPPPIARLSAALAPQGFPHPALTVEQFVAEFRHALRPLRPHQRLASAP